MTETVEYVVEQDGDPRPMTLYRGSDEILARKILTDVTPISGWGAVLYRRYVGPLEVLEVNR